MSHVIRKWTCRVSANWRMCGLGLHYHHGQPVGRNKGNRSVYPEFLFWTLTVGVVNYWVVTRGGQPCKA